MYEFFIFNHNSFIWDIFIKAVEAENPNGKVAFIDKVNEALLLYNGKPLCRVSYRSRLYYI